MSGRTLSPESLRAELASLAVLALARRAGPDRPWANGVEVERELLTSAGDLAAKLGATIVEQLDEAAPPAELDSGGAFAWALVLGSAVGEGADAAAEVAAQGLASVSSSARVACAEAVALSPSPRIGAAIARLLSTASEPLAKTALDVLRVRRDVPYAKVLPFLAHPSALVQVAAARCFGVVRDGGAAGAILLHLLRRTFDDNLRVAAAEALLELGNPGGLAFVRTRLRSEMDTPSLSDDARVAYLRLLALAGDASDRELFFRSVEAAPADAAAVGWYGHPDLVDWLLGSLEAANDARRSRGAGGPSVFETAAGRAIHRMLGAPGREGVPPGEGDAPMIDAGRWRAHWQSMRASAGSYKLRFGQPYDPLATVGELDAPVLPGGRAEASLELAIVSRGVTVLETGDWIARQRAVLGAARSALSRAAWPTGAFPGERLGAG